jgi:hypothetical protein
MPLPPRLLFVAVLSLACGAERVGLDPAAPERARPSKFVGLWSVEERGAATFYELFIDGALRTGRTIDPDATLPLGVTGWVARGGAICLFGREWWAPHLDALAIAADCDDAVPRDILLDASGARIELRAVGGDEDWSAPPEWHFRRCPLGADEQTCE